MPVQERTDLRAVSSAQPPRHPSVSSGPSVSPGGDQPARAEGEVNDTDVRLWHPWLRINRVLRAMLRTRWSAEAWTQVRVEFKKALALRSQSDSARGVVHVDLVKELHAGRPLAVAVPHVIEARLMGQPHIVLEALCACALGRRRAHPHRVRDLA